MEKNKIEAIEDHQEEADLDLLYSHLTNAVGKWMEEMPSLGRRLFALSRLSKLDVRIVIESRVGNDIFDLRDFSVVREMIGTIRDMEMKKE